MDSDILRQIKGLDNPNDPWGTTSPAATPSAPQQTGPRQWDPSAGPPPGYQFLYPVSMSSGVVEYAGPQLISPNGVVYYFKKSVPLAAVSDPFGNKVDPDKLAAALASAPAVAEAESANTQKLFNAGDTGSAGGSEASMLNAVTNLRQLEEYQIPSLELQRQKFEQVDLPTLMEESRQNAFNRLNAAVSDYLKAQADADSRRLEAIRTTIAALPYTMPPGMQYLPGSEPGGALDWVAKQIGFNFQPIPTTPVTLDTGSLQNPAELPPEIAQRLQQMFGQAQ